MRARGQNRYIPGGELDEKKCPDCGHPAGESCGGDFLHKDDAAEYVADNYEPWEEC